MKKVLALVLAVMMLFSAFTVSSSAAPIVAEEYYMSLKDSGVIKDDQVMITFDLLNSGATFKYPVSVYNDKEGTFTKSSSIKGVYYMIPNNNDLASSGFMTPGSSIILPEVIAPNGKDFKGWRYVDFAGREEILAAGSNFVIPEGSNTFGVISFTAVLVTGEIEGDFLDKILGILLEVVVSVLSNFLPAEMLEGLLEMI